MSVITRIYTDNETISGFTEAPPAAREGLNRTLALSLTPAAFAALQAAFRDRLHRNPTAGELRFLSAWQTVTMGLPCDEGVGELYTDSTPLAETWADMMAKHAALAQSLGTSSHATVPPATFEDLLGLTTHYLRRTGIRMGGLLCEGCALALVASSEEMAEVATRGYRPVHRLTTIPGGDLVLCLCPAHPEDGPGERRGDTLLLLRRAPISMIADLVAPADARNSLLGNICCLAGRTLPDAVENLCTGAALYGNRLFTEGQPYAVGDVPVAALSTRGTVTDERADFLVRIPRSRVLSLSEEMGKQGIVALVVGEVLDRPHLRVVLHTTPAGNEVNAVDLPFELMHAVTPLHLRRVRVEGALPASEEIPDSAACSVLRVPVGQATLLLAPVVVTIPAADTTSGFLPALQAVESAVTSLAAASEKTTQAMGLSVILQSEGAVSPGRLTEVLCGLYRATASYGLPLETAAMVLRLPAPATPGDAPLSLTVAAMAVLPQKAGAPADPGEPPPAKTEPTPAP